MERFNAAASHAAQVGFEAKVFGQVTLHRLCYSEIRQRFGLSSQMAVRAIAKAVESFQRDKSVCPVFRPGGAVCYDQRVLSFKGLTAVSLWATKGRLLIPFVCGAYQKARQGRIKGQADLVYRQGQWFRSRWRNKQYGIQSSRPEQVACIGISGDGLRRFVPASVMMPSTQTPDPLKRPEPSRWI